MTNEQIIRQTADYIRQEFSDDSSGHDWWHIYRVWKNAIAICEIEKADRFIVQLAALLHDLDDWKFNESGDETPHRARAWLDSLQVDSATAESVCRIIMHISYKGAGVENKWTHSKASSSRTPTGSTPLAQLASDAPSRMAGTRAA